MEASFALGRLMYFRAMAAETGKRIKAFCDAAGSSCASRWRSMTTASPTKRRSRRGRFYLASSLHLAAIEALRSEQKVAAAKWFVEARGVLKRIISRNIAPTEGANVFYRISRLLYADTSFFEATLSQEPAEREDFLRRAGSEYGAVADALQGTEQGLWARLQMAVVYKLLGEDEEADRQFDRAAAEYEKISQGLIDNPDKLSSAYIRQQIEWFRKTRSKID